MRDPYLYPDVNVLINRAGIKDPEILCKAEADITNLSMTAIYDKDYEKFNAETLCDIHRMIFGQIYEWAGEFRTIQIVKYEEVLHRVEKVESGNCPLINMHDPVRTKYSSFHIHIDLVSGKSIRRYPIGLSKKEKCDETCVFRDEKLQFRSL